MLVGLTGATGYVGRFVAQELHARGVGVRGLRRASSDTAGFDGPVEWVTGSLACDEALSRFVSGADAIVHCALEHLPGRYRGGEGADVGRFVEINLNGSLRLMHAARQAQVPRFVLLSSRAAYGDSAGVNPLREEGPTYPDTHYGACKAALDAFASSWGRGHGWNICTLRPTGVYGLVHPLERTKWIGLIDTIRRGEAWPECRRATEVHGSDLARAVWLLLRAKDVAGRVFNCSDLMVSTRDVAQLVQRLTGARGPLPAQPRDPAPPRMACDGLLAEGFTFGGMPLLERTVGQIVAMLERRQPISSNESRASEVVAIG